MRLVNVWQYKQIISNVLQINKQKIRHKQINRKAFQYDANCPLVDHIQQYPRLHVSRGYIHIPTPPEGTW